MPRQITPHDALIINEWWAAGISRPTLKGTAEAVRGAPRRVLSIIPGYSQIVDGLDAARYAKQQARLERLGGIAVVDLTPSGRPAEHRLKRERMLSILRESRIIEQGRIVAVQPIVFSTAVKEHQSTLSRRARTFSKRVDADKVGGETLFNPRPIVMDRKKGPVAKLYEAIDTAAIDLEEKNQELTGQKYGQGPAPSLVVAVGGTHVAAHLRGSTHDDVARSGVLVLHEVERLPRNNIWLPMPTPSGSLPPEGVESELPQPQDISSVRTVPTQTRPYTEVYF